MKKYNVVILGATGAVGIEFRKILLQRNFPINTIRFLGKTTVGKTIDFDDKKVTVENINNNLIRVSIPFNDDIISECYGE